jgi:hypothetical protein
LPTDAPADQAAPDGDEDAEPAATQVNPVTPAIGEGSRSTGPIGSPEGKTIQAPAVAAVDAEPGVEVQPGRAVIAGTARPAEPAETEAEPEVSTDPEPRRTVLIAEEPGSAEGVSDEEPEVDGDAGGGRRRRWWLFRRREDR